MNATVFRPLIALALSFASAVSTGFSAGAPRYYPAPDAPLTAEPFLAGIEAAFPVANPRATLKYPLPASGARLSTLDEFLAALKTALANDATHAGDIVVAARRAVRVSDGSRHNRPVPVDPVDLLIAAGTVPEAVPHLREILSQLVAEDPADAQALTVETARAAALGGATSAELGAIARTGLVALLQGFKPADAPFEEFVRAVMVGTITEDLGGRDNGDLATGLIAGFIDALQVRGLETPLIDDIMRGAARAFGSMPDVSLTDIATAGFTNATTTRQHTILISAACVLGTPFFYLDGPIDQEIADAGAAVLPTSANLISITATHALLIRLTELRVVGSETLARIEEEGTAFSDAIVCAALMANFTNAYDILRAGFDGTYGPGITPPPMSFAEWLRNCLSGNPRFVPESLDLVIEKGNQEDLFSGSVSMGDALGAAITASAPAFTDETIAKIKDLIGSGDAIEAPDDAGALTGALAASPQPLDVAQIVESVLIGDLASKTAKLRLAVLGVSDPNLRGVVAAAAILAEPESTAALTQAALAADPSATDNAAINAAIAGTQLASVARAPRWRIAEVVRSLLTIHSAEPVALIYGALTALPAQTLTILSAALAADDTFTMESTRALDPAHASAYALAARIAAAEALDATDPGATLAMLFDAVDSAVLAHPTDVLDLTAAASIVAPRYAHHTLHAAAFRHPAVALRTVEVTFDAAPIGRAGNQTGRAAAVGAALVNGIREARTGIYAATQLRLAVGSAVKAARGLSGPIVQSSNGVPGRVIRTTSNGPAAVITGVASQMTVETDVAFRGAFLLAAATPKAPTHALAMAQATAQAAVSIAGAKVNTTSIVNAVIAGGARFNATQIRTATNFGKLQARRGVAGAGADGVRNYQHRSATTDPLASLDELDQ